MVKRLAVAVKSEQSTEGKQGPTGSPEPKLNHAEPKLNLLNLLHIRCRINSPAKLKIKCG